MYKQGLLRNILTLEAPTHKMVKHTQTIHRLLPTNYLSVFDHFVGLALKELKIAYENGTFIFL